MQNAKQVLQLLSTALNAAPIPDPFKSAVTAIPDIALQIIEIVDAVKGNVEDAKDLAVYIATVTDKALRPFKTKPGELDRSPDTKMRLDEFRGVLEKIEAEMLTLMSRRLRSRILSYGDDTSKLAAMKQSVDDAINQLQLETVVAIGHAVDMIQQNQHLIAEEQRRDMRIAFQKQEDRDRMAAQQQIQQQLFASRQQHLSDQERRVSEIDLLINLLGTGDTGAAKKPPCLAGTREHVLGSIKGWIDDTSSGSKHCYLLLGPAGTGKSAIASSIAKGEMKSQRLGGVFHFTREEQARNNDAILTLARQLASWGGRRLRSKIGSAIESAVKEGLDLGRMAPENQFQELIVEPLETLDSDSPTLVVILDALDECDEEYATTLLRLLGGLLDKLPDQVKLLITSRGEPHLQQLYDSDPLESRQETHSLGDEELGRVEEDISLYFKERLPGLVGRWVAKPSDWPGEDKRRALVQKTQGLFICATTMARMLTDPKSRNPEKQLNDILSLKNSVRLDDIYAQVLERACPTGSDDDLVELFRTVLGAIVVAQVPINTHTLASLLPRNGAQHDEFAYRIRGTVLSYLQAVLIVPDVETSEVVEDAQPTRFIHSSFIDYLTDESRCVPRFLVDPCKQHKTLAIGCLQRMRDLKRNMCNLDPSLLNSEVEDLAQRIRDNLSPGLQYACAHMPTHVSQTPTDNVEVDSLMEEFAEVKLMYWLEALSLMGRVHEAVGMAALIESWVRVGLHPHPLASPPSSNTATFVHPLSEPRDHPIIPTHSPETALGKRARLKRFFGKLGTSARVPSLAAAAPTPLHGPSLPATLHTDIPIKSKGYTVGIFHDLQRFVMTFMDPIVTSSLHIYSSALVLMPPDTELSRKYGQCAESGIRAVRGRANGWSQTLWTATKHSNIIRCVAMSPDGTTIVSGSIDNTLHLWDAKTGAAIGKAMNGHTDWVDCVVVSPDGTTIVSGSGDKTLRLWDARTGVAIGKAMKGHTDRVTCVTISSIGTTIVSGSFDNTLHLWDVRTGAAIGEAMEGHTSVVHCIAVSPDGKSIVSGSFDNTLCLWDVRTGAAIGKVMEGHTKMINCVAVSPNGKYIVLGSEDKTLCLWDIQTGAAIGEAVEGHTSAVHCVAVYHDGSIIVSGSDDKTLCLWDAKTGAAIGKTMEGHTEAVHCVTMFPDGKSIVSGSDDSTLHLWDARTGAAIGEAMEGHALPIHCVA
ncbi:hypothetical protein FRB94_008087, partial [Tulasnella sp. JGI-2019a]